MSEATSTAFIAVPVELAKALDALLASDPRVQILLALRQCQMVPEGRPQLPTDRQD